MLNRLKILTHRFYRKLVHPIPIKNSPDFMIIGAQKAGTTSLHAMLVKHPQLNGGLKKEVHFFDRERNYRKGYNWYHKNFKDISAKDIKYFDATPDYVAYREVLERIKSYNPNIKLIFILREPSSRAYSAWNFYKRFKRYQNLPNFHEVVNHEIEVMEGKREEDWISELKIIRRGFYHQQIKVLESLFPSDNILLLRSNDLKSNPDYVLNNILNFINLSTYNWNLNQAKRNTGNYTGKISRADRERLKLMYKNDLDGLERDYQINFK